MKTKILSLIAIATISFAVNAQIDRSKMPKPGPDPVVKLGKAKTFTLKNGLKVIMVENHKLPKVSVILTIDNKPVTEGNKAGLSSLMGDLLGRGTRNITKDEFNERVDFLGANINFSDSGASAGSLTSYFPEVLGLMADGIKNSQFTKEEFDKEIKATLDNLKMGEKNVAAIASRVEDALIYGKNHPFGEITSKETIKNISLEDVKNDYATYYKPNNAYLVIVGDINSKKTKKLVKKLFNNWTKGTIPTSNITKPTNVKTAEIDFVNMPNAVQSEIAVINNINLKLGDKDYYAALLANQILGGGGTARLFMNLREDKAYTYGSYSSINQSRYAASFRATASVRNIVTDSSVVEIQKEIHKIRNQKVSKEELKNAKAKYLGNFIMNVQKPRTAAIYALNIAVYNLPKDFYANYIKNINAVTLEDVQNAAIKYFKGDNARIVITGKGTEVLKNLEKGNYPIHYFDIYGNPTTKPKMDMPVPAGMTAAKVVDNYFKAIGGFDKTKAIKTILTSANAKVQGMAINLTTKTAAPNKVSAVLSNMGRVLSKQIFDGEKGYAEQQGRKTDLTAKQIKEAKEKTLFTDETYKSGKLDRIENIEGKNAYVIISGKTEAYYDVKSGLKVKEVVTSKARGKEFKIPTTFSDYKEVNGVKFPYKISMKMGPMNMEFIVKEIKINKGVTDADFK